MKYTRSCACLTHQTLKNKLYGFGKPRLSGDGMDASSPYRMAGKTKKVLAFWKFLARIAPAKALFSFDLFRELQFIHLIHISTSLSCESIAYSHYNLIQWYVGSILPIPPINELRAKLSLPRIEA